MKGRVGFRLLVVAVTAVLLGSLGLAAAQDEAQVSGGAPALVSYQGQVRLGGVPFTGTGYFKFTVVDSGGGTNYWANDGTASGEPGASVSVPVSQGLFSVLLGDAGLGMVQVPATAFSGTDRYLRVWFSSDGGTFVLLSPDRRIAAVPYAFQAQEAADADTLDGQQGSAYQLRVSGTCDAGNAIRVVNADGSVTCEPVSGTGGGWLLAGNAGTAPGTDYLGTSDEQALELKVNGSRALRLEPNATSPNLLGGYSGNWITAGVAAAAIGGGGNSTDPNRVTDHYGTVGGGTANQAGNNTGTVDDAPYATVGGGYLNTASSYAATVGGGDHNSVSGSSSTVGGGRWNVASGWGTIVGGGFDNDATGNSATVGGGQANTAGGENATVGGGRSNSASNKAAAVGGGEHNEALGQHDTIAGGLYNTANGVYSSVGGGYSNYAMVDYATIAGGENNEASGSRATACGGQANIAGGSYSTVPGGVSNTAAGAYSFAAGNRAKANNQGCFVWADSTAADFVCSTDNQFAVRANGGVSFQTGTAAVQVNGNLVWHAGNDGTGSTLDADLLDGQHASAFAGSAHTHAALTPGTGLGGTAYNGGTAISDWHVAYGTAAGSAVQGNQTATITAGTGLTGGVASDALGDGFTAALNVGAGNGIAAATDSVALGSLTANWSQTGAVDIVLGNASSELRILESAGATYYGAFDVGDLGADQNYTFGVGGTVWTSGNDGTGSTLDADLLDGQHASAFSAAGSGWLLTGNAGTTPGTNYLGTSDNQALELKTNGARALRLEPNATSPNLLGGYFGNWLTSGVYGATVGGGGASTALNRVTDNYGTVGGGLANQAGDNAGTTTDTIYATVGGGWQNAASNYAATVGGGQDNIASGSVSSVAGGRQNSAVGWGATIAGGYSNSAAGASATVSGGELNGAPGLYATVGGGYSNSASGERATVGGGDSNGASKSYATVSGGQLNTASGQYATVAGGSSNGASQPYATVAGGQVNTAGAISASVGGGFSNDASGTYATVAGGGDNAASGSVAAIAGGYGNTASGSGAATGGGAGNIASGDYSTVPGGVANSAAGNYSFAAGYRAKANNQACFVWADSTDADYVCSTDNRFAARATGGFTLDLDGSGSGLRLEPNATSPSLLGGYSGNWLTSGAYGATIVGGGAATALNRVTDNYGTVGGGLGNQAGDNAGTTADTIYATVGGGWLNAASNYAATVGGGRENTASGSVSSVAGGRSNNASGWGATIAGGYLNSATADSATIGGGYEGLASGLYTTVGGGYSNSAGGERATVGGGDSNSASGNYSTVPGGVNNTAGGAYSFAAGHGAKANNQGCFVWADSTPADLTCSTNNKWLARAAGGVTFYTNANMTTGVTVAAGGGSWSSVSDRNLKQNVQEVDPQAILESLARVPVSTWSYKSQDTSIRHIGPMAQDFYAAFGVGEDDTHITTVDADGVAMAAIQALYAENQALKAESNGQQAQIDALQKQNADLDARLTALEAAGAKPASAGARLPVPWLLLAGGLVVAGGTWAVRRRSGGVR